MTTAKDTLSSHGGERRFFGHPRGLAILFLTEMWERFSYYGMRAMLVTYLLWHFFKSETTSYSIYAAYAGMLYLMPLIGGYLADRMLGTRRAIAFGAILITCGHFAMTIEGQPGTEAVVTPQGRYELTHMPNPDGDTPQFVRNIAVDGTELRVETLAVTGDRATVTFRRPGGGEASIEGRIERHGDPFGENMMFMALALIAVGTGFVKANISSIVGALYEKGDPRRDAGFTVFYMGINLGALMGIASVGYVGIAYGWSYGFGLAGIGMLAGLAIFLTHQHWLQGAGDPPDRAWLKAPFLGPLTHEWGIYLASVLGVGVVWLIVKFLGQWGLADLLALFGLSVGAVPILGELTLFDLLVNIIFIGLVAGLLTHAFRGLAGAARGRLLVLLVLVLASVVFLTLFEQAPISLLVFQMRFVDTGIFTAQQVGLFNPVFILLLGPFFIFLWAWLGRKGREPSTPVKFAFGLVLVGAGYLVLCLGIATDGQDLVVGIVWVGLLYLLHTLGELCLQPVGLSAVTKLAPAHMVSFLMGVWLMSFSLAEVLAALVSKATVVPEGTSRTAAIAQFNTVFLWLGIVSVAAGIVVFIVSPALRRLGGETASENG
jgi:POT family proton-dependent oligopeptide transporter